MRGAVIAALVAAALTGCSTHGTTGDARTGRFDAPAGPVSMDLLVVMSTGGNILTRTALASFVGKLAERWQSGPSAIADFRVGVVTSALTHPGICETTPPLDGRLVPLSTSDTAILTQQATSDDIARLASARAGYDCAGPTELLESAALAVDGRNAGFPRSDALLMLLFLTDEDDCSLADPALWHKDALWPDPGYSPRCYEAPVLAMHSVGHYADRIAKAHPGHIFVGVVAAEGELTWGHRGHGLYTPEPVCGQWDKPVLLAPRMIDFVSAIEQRGEPGFTAQHLDIACDIIRADHSAAEPLARHVALLLVDS